MKLLPMLLLGGLFASCALVSAQTPTPIANLGQSCHLPGYDAPLRCLRLEVPKDYAQATGGKLSLHITIAPAFREKAHPDPVLVLAGGPGQSGSSVIGLLESGFQRVRATRDIIFIDQRGTGKSGKLYCDSLNRSQTLDPEQSERELQDCFRSLAPQLAYYSTTAAAQDIERVRQALGVTRINLWGGSYGTRLALAYAQQFPGQLRSMVLDGVTSPQQNIGLISAETGRALTLLRQACAKDVACHTRFPKFAEQLDALMQRAKSGTQTISFAHPVTGEKLRLPLKHEMIAEMLRTMLYHPHNAARLPWMVEQAHADNWEPLLALSLPNQSWSQDGMALGLTLAVLCAEDVAHISPTQLLAETPLSFLGDSWARKLQRWCGVVKLPARARPASGIVQTPSLLLSGQYDPVTPPQRAQETMLVLPRSQHLQAASLGHIITPHACGARLLRQFFDAPEKKLDGKCLAEVARPPFVLSAAGAQP